MTSQTVTDGREGNDGDGQTASTRAARRPTRFSQLRWAGPLAIGVAAVVNGLLFLLADAFGAFPGDVINPPSGQPFTVVDVAIASAIGALGATVLYTLLDRFVSDADRWFRLVAGVVLLVSFATPFTIPGASTATVGALLAMHVVVAGVSIWMLTVRGGG